MSNLFLNKRVSAQSSFAASSHNNVDTKRVNAFMNMGDSNTATNTFASPSPRLVPTNNNAVAAANDEFPMLKMATTAAAGAAGSGVPRTGLNYKASLLTAIDGRMLQEQERMRHEQRKAADNKRELYDKMKYDEDRAANARAALDPEYSVHGANDATLDNDVESFYTKQRRAA